MIARSTPWIISAILLFLVAGVGLANLIIPVALGSLTISSAQVGVFYSATIPVTGGVPNFTYSIVSGSLPHNLTFSPTTLTSATTITISGTPDVAGTANFTFQVVDSSSVPPPDDPLSPSDGPDGQAAARRLGLAHTGGHAAGVSTRAYSIVVAPAAPSSTPVPPSVWMAMTGLAGAGLFRLRQKRRG
jgi:hypothetical protein